MPDTYLTGAIVDVRRRVRFVPADATVVSCKDPLVLVFNQQGHFFVPNLEPGRTYEFMVRNGAVSKRWRITPKRGHNEIMLAVPTKPARAARAQKPPLLQRQAGA